MAWGTEAFTALPGCVRAPFGVALSCVGAPFGVARSCVAHCCIMVVFLGCVRAPFGVDLSCVGAPFGVRAGGVASRVAEWVVWFELWGCVRACVALLVYFARRQFKPQTQPQPQRSHNRNAATTQRIQSPFANH